MARVVFWGTVATLLVSGLYFGFWRERPYVLIRFTAARAIQATAEFQHKTKLFFEVGQAEGIFPGVCHNFEFAPSRIATFKRYAQARTMQFVPYRNQIPPYEAASVGSLDLSIGDEKYLVDTIDVCKLHEVKEDTGAYELSLGTSIVKATDIRAQENRASVDFHWHFDSLSHVGKALPRIQSTKNMQIADSRTTPYERSIAPFWLGSAVFQKYDDGWRVLNIKLSSDYYPWGIWAYGPEWPDERFDWGAFDEHENRWGSHADKAE